LLTSRKNPGSEDPGYSISTAESILTRISYEKLVIAENAFHRIQTKGRFGPVE